MFWILCHTYLDDWGVVLNDNNEKNRFAVSMLMLYSQSLLEICNYSDNAGDSVMSLSHLYCAQMD